MLFRNCLVVVRGGGDLASGVIFRLWRAGFPVAVTELAQPLVIRRAVAFASAVFEGHATVEGITARCVETPGGVSGALVAGEIPVLVDPDGRSLLELQPRVVVDARIAKTNLGTTLHDAPLVIGMGPGFEAQHDCHAVIETKRGHSLGRVLWEGAASPNTGQPGAVQGHMGERVLRAPMVGQVVAHAAIGDNLVKGATVGEVNGVPIFAPLDGVLRGLIHPSVTVQAGMKIGDIDPRSDASFCFSISDKALAVGGSVVEAILSAPQMRSVLCANR